MQTLYIAYATVFVQSNNSFDHAFRPEISCLGVYNTLEAAKEACIRSMTFPRASRVINMLHDQYTVEARNLNEACVAPVAKWQLNYSERMLQHIHTLMTCHSKEDTDTVKKTLHAFVKSWNKDLSIAMAFYNNAWERV